jgi:hypothetical protein
VASQNGESLKNHIPVGCCETVRIVLKEMAAILPSRARECCWALFCSGLVITWNECKWLRQYWCFKSEKTHLFRNISCLFDQLKKKTRRLKQMSFLHTRYGNLIGFPVEKTSNKSWSLALSRSVLSISCHLSKAISESLNSFGIWRVGRVSWRLANASSSPVVLLI